MANVNFIAGRKGGMGWIFGGAAMAALLFSASSASAQVSYEGSYQAQGPAAPAPAATSQGGTDHDMFVGRVGLGWYGVSDIPVGAGGGTVSAPAIGVRYWMSRDLGLDVGIGFSTASGSTTQGGDKADKPSRTGFLLHGGLPFALHVEKHYAFLITPELNFGYAMGSDGDNIDHSGMRFDLGARAGAEVHFGFMGIPALALEGSVGLFFTTQSGSTETAGVTAKNSDTFIGTTSFNSPWDFFRSSVAARYYF